MAARTRVPRRTHGRAEQQSQRRVTRHRIIFLRGGEGEEDQQEAGPGERQQTRAPGAVDRLEREPRDRRKVDAPGKQPDEMEEPEVEARDGVVVARITKIQEAQHLLVDEIEPQKAVVFAGNATPGEVENRRVAQSRQHVPGRRDGQRDDEAAPHVQPLPYLRRKQLPRE
jgi:hypothetical protein